MSTSSKVLCTCNSVATAGFNFCEIHGVAQPRPAPDHGVSPAQLSEKVEALNSRIDAWLSALPELPNDVQAMVVRHENELRQAFEVQLEDRARLDAALKRIEELERARPTRPENVWKNDPALTVTHVDAENGVVTLERKP